MLEMINTTKTSIPAGTTIPFTDITFNTNGNATGNTITGIATITTPGYYNVTGNFVVSANSAGAVIFDMITDGNAEAGGVAEFSTSNAGDYSTLSIQKMIQVVPAASGTSAQVSFQSNTSSVEATMFNAVMQIEQIR